MLCVCLLTVGQLLLYCHPSSSSWEPGWRNSQATQGLWKALLRDGTRHSHPHLVTRIEGANWNLGTEAHRGPCSWSASSQIGSRWTQGKRKSSRAPWRGLGRPESSLELCVNMWGRWVHSGGMCLSVGPQRDVPMAVTWTHYWSESPNFITYSLLKAFSHIRKISIVFILLILSHRRKGELQKEALVKLSYESTCCEHRAKSSCYLTWGSLPKLLLFITSPFYKWS